MIQKDFVSVVSEGYKTEGIVIELSEQERAMLERLDAGLVIRGKPAEPCQAFERLRVLDFIVPKARRVYRISTAGRWALRASQRRAS